MAKIPYSDDRQAIEQQQKKRFAKLVERTGIKPSSAESWRDIAFELALQLPQMQVEEKRGPKPKGAQLPHADLLKLAKAIRAHRDCIWEEAAREAGLGESTLYHYLRKLNAPETPGAMRDFIEFLYPVKDSAIDE